MRPGGFLQFSILHPCFVPPHRRVFREPDGTTRAIEIAGYFDATDGRIDTWWLTNVPQEERERTEPFRVPRFHRTLSGWVDLILEAGLVIERFNEPCVSVELAKAKPVFEDTRVAPPFLHIRVIKPAAPPANRPRLQRDVARPRARNNRSMPKGPRGKSGEWDDISTIGKGFPDFTR